MMQKRAALMLVLPLLTTACGGSMMYKTNMETFVNPNTPGTRYDVIAVLPMEQTNFDAQVAGRAKEKLRQANIKYVPALKAVAEGEVGMPDVCPKDNPPPYKGVLFVTWDRIILRDCETHAVAFRVIGNYAGIDKMIQKYETFVKVPGSK